MEDRKRRRWIRHLLHKVRKSFDEAHYAVQFVSTVSACLLTYAVINRNSSGLSYDANLISMVIVTLCGATFPHLVACVASGVYAGSVSANVVADNYGWVLLLGVVTGLAWQLVSLSGAMLGFSGRLGATAFVGMNITAIIVFAIDPKVSFEKYGSVQNLWDEVLSLEESLCSVLACVFMAYSAGLFRLVASVPVNPVLVPSAWALFCMLVTGVTEYQYTASIFQGYAIGAYVAMASEARVPTAAHFALVGLIAGMWNIFLQPFFLGFGGKAGFTSMIGYSTYLLFKTIYKKKLRKSLKRFLRRSTPPEAGNVREKKNEGGQ